jgi:hypothetical protein
LSIHLSFFGRHDAIFFDEPIKHMEEDSVWQSHANGIVAIANRLGEIRKEHVQEGGVHGDDVRSGLLGKSVRKLEHFMLVAVRAVVEVWYFFNFLRKQKECFGIGLFCEEGIEVWRGCAEQHVHVFRCWHLMCLSALARMEHQFN